MRLSDLLGCMVIDESGRSLGHVIDARADERGNRVEVTELLVGRQAFVHRVFGGREGHGEGRTGPHDAVPWEAVVDVEPGRRVVVREGTEPGQGEEIRR
jgi:sporulation protein YlmC with PRC-barrel domain